MIELKNISTLNIIGFESGKKNPAGISKKNYKLIKENKLTDYQQLKDFYLKLHESVVYCKPSIFCETDGLKKMIMETEYALDNCYNDPELFEYYKLSNTANALYDHEVVDYNTCARDLLYGSPFEYGDNDYKKRSSLISPLNIYELKQCLTHCNTSGKNMLKLILNIDDNKEIERILRALYLYEEQLERQAFELNGSENKGQKDKLFYLNINKKIDLIKPQLREIINYFVYNANELVWEEKPGKDILRISDAVYSHSCQNVHDRDRIAYSLGNYVSLEEAKKGLVKTKAIDRFILR